METPEKLKKLSKLRREEAIKRSKAEYEERLAAMGQESDKKGIKWVSEDIKEKEKRDKKVEEESLISLETLKKDKRRYYAFLVMLLYKFLKGEDIPNRYVIEVGGTEKGILVTIRNTDLYKAFTPSFIEKFDFFACRALAVEVGNTIAHLEGFRHKSEGGILLPDELDIKKHGNIRRSNIK